MLRYVEICWDMLRYVDMFRSPDIDAINMPSTGSMGGFQDLRPPASSHPWCQTLTRTRQRSLKLLIETCCPYFCLHGLVWFSHFQHGSNGSHCPSVCYCVFFGSYSLHQENEEAVVKGGKEFLLKYFEIFWSIYSISRYIKIYQDISRYIKYIKYIKHSWALKVPIGQLGDVCFIGSLGVFPGLSVNTFGTGCMWTVCSVCLCIVCLCGAQLSAIVGHFAVAKSTPNANATPLRATPGTSWTRKHQLARPPLAVDIFQILPGWCGWRWIPTDVTGTPTKRHRPAPLSCWPKTHAVLCQEKHYSNETL